jgi:hypothetical protein
MAMKRMIRRALFLPLRLLQKHHQHLMELELKSPVLKESRSPSQQMMT